MKITPSTTNSPSRKQTKVAIAALVLICIVVLAWLLRPAPEPTYNDKPFSICLEESSRQNRGSENYLNVRAALGKMGARAIPIIIHTLEQNDSPMLNKYRETWSTLPSWVKMVLPKPRPEAFSTHDASAALYFVPVRIVIPQLSRLAQSHNPAVREAVFDYLLRFPDDTDLISHEYLLSLCLPALTDPSPYVRQCAAHAAARAGPSASNAIPELIRSLQGKIKGRRKETFSFSCGLTAKALGNIGPPAASSVPLLLKELTNGRNDTVTLIAVTNALKSIDPEAAAKAGVK